MFYVFQFKDLKKKMDEFGSRDGMYYRFRSKRAAYEFAQKSKKRIVVLSSDKELKMLKHRGIIDYFCYDKDYVAKPKKGNL